MAVTKEEEEEEEEEEGCSGLPKQSRCHSRLVWPPLENSNPAYLAYLEERRKRQPADFTQRNMVGREGE